MKSKFLSILAILFAGAIALGQMPEEQFKAADAELNRVYKKLRANLNEDQKAELKKSQIGWINEKEKAAKEATSESQKLTILLRKTIERLEVLKKIEIGSYIASESNQVKQEKKINLLKNELQKCNAELNQVYKNLYQILNNSEKASLEASQKKWLGKINFYNSGLLMQLLEDRVKATKERIVELNNLYLIASKKPNTIYNLKYELEVSSSEMNEILSQLEDSDFRHIAAIEQKNWNIYKNQLINKLNSNQAKNEALLELNKDRITYLRQLLKEARDSAFKQQVNILELNYIISKQDFAAQKINKYLDNIKNGTARSDFIEFFYNISSPKLAYSEEEFKVYDASESESFFADLASPWPLERTSAMKSDHAVAPIQVVPQTRRPAGKLASEARGKEVIARSFINDPHVYVFDARSEVELFRFIPTIEPMRDKNMTPIHLCLSADERLLSCSTGLGLCGLNGSGGGLNAVYVANLKSRELISRAHSLSLFFESSDGAVKLGDSRQLKDNDPLQLWRDGKKDGKPAPWMNLIRFNELELSAKLFSAETKECIVNRFSREDLLDKDGQIYGKHGDAFVTQPKPGTTSEWTVVWPEVFGSGKAFTIHPTTGWVKLAKESFQPTTTVESSSHLAGHVWDGGHNFWAHLLGCSAPTSNFMNLPVFKNVYRSIDGVFMLVSINVGHGWGEGRTFAVFSDEGKNAVALPTLTDLSLDYSKFGRNYGKPTSLPVPLPEILKINSENRHHYYDLNRRELYISSDSAGLIRLDSGRKKDPEIFSGIPAFDFFAVRGNIVLGVPDRAVAKMQLWGLNGVHLADIFPSLFGSMLVSVPEGFYLSSGHSGTAFRIGVRGYPFEQFDLRLNRPDIVLERLGAPDEAIAIAKQLREKRLKRMGVSEDMLQPDFHLPEIEIVGDLPSSTMEGELVLKIKASDSKYPLDRLRVYVNNVPVNGREGELLRDAKSQSLERTIPIKLAAGRNKIQVSVLNSAGAESLYANAEVTCTAQRSKPTLYAVAMGVSEYANPQWNLKYAAKDARDILERVKARSGSSYGEIKELLLTDREVTKESLGKIRNFLSSATVDDTVLLFVAGHGLLDSKYDYYFGTSDIDFDNPSANGIAFEEFDDLLAELPCLRKSLLIDTCHAGELDEDEKKMLASAQASPNQVIAMLPTGARGMTIKPIEGARGKSEWYDRLQGLFVDLRRGSGSTILSSSAGAEYALESSEQKNGLFTYAVIEALDGKEGSDANKDGSVTMSELADYVKTRVAALTNNKQSPNVRRVNLEGDFSLSKK